MHVIIESQGTYGSFCFVFSTLMPPAVGELPEKREKKCS